MCVQAEVNVQRPGGAVSSLHRGLFVVGRGIGLFYGAGRQGDEVFAGRLVMVGFVSRTEPASGGGGSA